MLSIHKFALEIRSVQEVMMPERASIMYIEAQLGEPQLLVLLNPEDDRNTSYRIVMLGNEHGVSADLLEDCAYLGTAQVGPNVWHYFIEVSE